MAVQIGGKPDAGFNDPLAMLEDCHRRIERFLSLLCRVAERAEGRALSGEEGEAVEAALNYFRESGPRHNCDEEESLFPRLRTAPGVGVLAQANVFAQIDRLEGEHHQAAVLHRETEELYAQWIAEGGLHGANRSRLRAACSQLEAIYQEHIRIEEGVVFPHAKTVLDRETLAAMGEEFRTRRSQ